MQRTSLIYIWGYVAAKYRKKFPHLGDFSKNMLETSNTDYQWINTVSNGFLTCPSEILIKAGDIVEKHFLSVHGNKISFKKFIFTEVTNLAYKDILAENLDVPECVIRSMVITRTYVRIKHLNKLEKEKNLKKLCSRIFNSENSNEEKHEKKNIQKKFEKFIK